MRTIPTMIATIATSRGAARRPLPLTRTVRIASRGTRKFWFKTPARVSLAQEGLQPPSRFFLPTYRTRSCHRYADHLYSTSNPPNHAEWKAALKNPKFTAYDLWMSEALTLLNKGLCPPDHPSPSGGYNTERVLEGSEHDPAPCFAAPHHRHLELHWSPVQIFPPTVATTWRITDVWDSIPPEEETGSYAAYYFGWHPVAQSWGYHKYRAVGSATWDCTIDAPSHPYFLQTDYYWRQGRTRRYHLAADHKHPWDATCPTTRPWSCKPAYPFPVPIP